MNLSNNNDKKTKKSGIASLFGRGSVSKIGKSQFPNSMGGIMERLKGLSRKDLAMVGVGLSVLVAAPVAEYMMSKPADSANMLTSGFSSRDGDGTSALASLYEPGINALSQGSADGTGEVITPLSARDPASLIMGAQPEMPMVDYSSMAGMGGDSGSSGSSSSSSAPEFNDMRDSVKDSAKHGAAKAMQSAGAPTVIPRMGTVFRGGFGEIKSAGGTNVSGGFKKGLTAPIKSNATPKQSKMVNPVATAGYKGASNTPNSADSSAADRLRAKADVQGGYFSGASAIKAADSANSVKMNDKIGDGAGFGGTGHGNSGGYKGPSNHGPNNSHKHGGECNTLACQAAKKRQDKALEWEFFLKYDIPKKFIEAGIGLATGLLTDAVKTGVDILLWNKDVDGITKYYCLVKIDPNKPCKKGNVKYTKYSRKSKTYGDWKDCTCDKWTKSEMKEMFGNVGPDGDIDPDPDLNGNGGGDPAQETPSDNDIGSQYEKYVRSYDEGLHKFMGEMAEVLKYQDSKKNDYGWPKAKSAADTYTSSVDGAGFGLPYSNIFSLVAHEYENDKKQLGANKGDIEKLQDKKKQAEDEKEKFIKTLNEILEKPKDYRKDIAGLENATSGKSDEEITKAVKDAIKKYEDAYVVHVIYPTRNLDAHLKACGVLSARLEESKGQMDRVFYKEYREQKINRVEEIKKELEVKDKSKKELVKGFLDGMTGDLYNTDKKGEGNGKYHYTVVEGSGKNYYPQQHMWVWRGFSEFFATDDDRQNYENEAKKIQAREQDAWKYHDSPLNPLEDYSPREVENETKMTKTDFYAPGYRIVVEIPQALLEQHNAVDNKTKSVDMFLALKSQIEAELDGEGITTTPNVGSTPSNPSSPDPVTPSPSAVRNPSYKDVKASEQNAKELYHAYQGNKSKIWNGDMLYHDLPPEWQADAVPGCDYNVNAIQTHYLRREYVKLEADMEQARIDGNTEKVKELTDQRRALEDEIKKSVNRTNYAWAQICENHKKTQAGKKACYKGVSTPETPSSSVNNGGNSNPGSSNNNTPGSSVPPVSPTPSVPDTPSVPATPDVPATPVIPPTPAVPELPNYVAPQDHTYVAHPQPQAYLTKIVQGKWGPYSYMVTRNWNDSFYEKFTMHGRIYNYMNLKAANMQVSCSKDGDNTYRISDVLIFIKGGPVHFEDVIGTYCP